MRHKDTITADGDTDDEDTVDLSEVTGDADRDAPGRFGRGERTERTVSPKHVDATLRDGRVSIEGKTRTASLTARPASHTPLGEDGVAARLHLSDGDDLDVEVSLKPADVTAIRNALESVGAAEVNKGP